MQLRDIIKYVEQCDRGTPTSITLYNPHSWRGDNKQLGFDYKLKPSTRKEMLEVLRSPIGYKYLDWRGGNYHEMGLECFVYLGSPGLSGSPRDPGHGDQPLSMLMLQHIMGYVYVQNVAEHYAQPYLAGDRKKLEKMGRVLLHANENTDMTEVWELAIAMQTRVGPHSPEGFLADYRSLERVDGDLEDARFYYRDLCARLRLHGACRAVGEHEAENPYSNEDNP